jgi:hypothetical protein
MEQLSTSQKSNPQYHADMIFTIDMLKSKDQYREVQEKFNQKFLDSMKGLSKADAAQIVINYKHVPEPSETSTKIIKTVS